MKELIGKLQKDLTKLQQTVEKESNALIKKIKAAAAQKGMPIDAERIETLLEAQIRRFEPAFDKFYKGVKTNAGKYGFNLDGLEERVAKTASAARSKLRAQSGKGTGKSSGKASAKSAGATKKKSGATAAKSHKKASGTSRRKSTSRG